jgi:hypothetical protein
MSDKFIFGVLINKYYIIISIPILYNMPHHHHTLSFHFNHLGKAIELPKPKRVQISFIGKAIEKAGHTLNDKLDIREIKKEIKQMGNTLSNVKLVSAELNKIEDKMTTEVQSDIIKVSNTVKKAETTVVNGVKKAETTVVNGVKSAESGVLNLANTLSSVTDILPTSQPDTLGGDTDQTELNNQSTTPLQPEADNQPKQKAVHFTFSTNHIAIVPL